MLDRIALLAGVSAIGALLVSAGPSSSGTDVVHPTSIEAAVSSKGDRLSVAVAKAYRSPVASVTKSTEGRAISVSMRDPMGNVVYLSDASARYTAVARDASYADLPTATQPGSRSVGEVVAQSGTGDVGMKVPVGCDRTVSVLTGSSLARRASKCIT